MKKIRVIALIMAVVMLCMCMAACGGSNKVRVNCSVSVIIDGEELFGPYSLQVEGTTENPPTVLQAAREAFTVCEVPFEVDENGYSFTSITIDGTAYAKGSDEENIYTWYYTADDVEPDSGRAGTNPVTEGQHIKFIYSATPINPQEFSDGNN